MATQLPDSASKVYNKYAETNLELIDLYFKEIEKIKNSLDLPLEKGF